MARKTKAEREESIDQLREWFKPGDTIYTVCRSVSASGMSGTYSLVFFRDGSPRHPNYHAAAVTAHTLTRDRTTGSDALRVSGCGFDRAYQIVYDLGRALYGDGYAFKHEAI